MESVDKSDPEVPVLKKSSSIYREMGSREYN